ncbi:sensor domain-containing phosphodiesterase [Thioclava kandeliae]|uniref:EAL domain-containing protein n=1 Tax=Thioclava kandeliae TaxID=3070818 RepID=A0ABV1SL99_9RHOB
MFSSEFREMISTDLGNSLENLRWKKRKILASLRDFYGMEVAFISRFTKDQRIIDEVISDHDAFRGISKESSSRLDQSYCYRVANGQTPNLIKDARKEISVVDIPETRLLPIGAHISVPIRLSSGKIHGMLCAFQRSARDDLTARDLSMFELCAALIGRDIDSLLINNPADMLGTEEMQKLIEQNEFQTNLQPIIRLPQREVCGFEALTSFSDHPGTTEQVFSHAKHLDLISSLEERAAIQAAQFIPTLPHKCFLALNFSVSSIEDLDFTTIFSPEDRKKIVIEVTEHEKVDDYGKFLAAVGRMRKIGLRLAVDDVGAGFASLRHVMHLKPDIIKLDRSFCDAIDKRSGQRGLIKAILDYATNYGAELLAEGIETEMDLAAIQAIGVTMAQGYHIGRPSPATSVCITQKT